MRLKKLKIDKNYAKKINSLFYPEVLHPTPKGSHIGKEEINQFHEDWFLSELVFFGN